VLEATLEMDSLIRNHSANRILVVQRAVTKQRKLKSPKVGVGNGPLKTALFSPTSHCSCQRRAGVSNLTIS
jgi:hypothetical protein